MQYPILEPTSNGTFKLYKDYEINGIFVPKGFETDGLTLKIRLLRLLVDKYQPKFSSFFVVHDWFCSINNYKQADDVGSQILFKIENSFRTRLMMKAIRLYHRIKYGVK